MTPQADSAVADTLPVIRIEPARGWFALDLRELWAYRELVAFLVWRDIKVRYKQTVLGVLWAVIQPVGTMVLFTVIFGRLAKLPSDGVPYPIFTLAALLPWQLFSSALLGAANSVVGSAGLITKVYFPRLVVPIAAVASNLVDFGVSLAVLVALMAWYGVAPSAAVVLLPAFVLLAVVTAFAAGLWLAALNVKYRDVRYLLPYLTQVLLFASPVAYSTSLIESPVWRTVYGLNPMAGIIQGFRWALLGAQPPADLILPGVIVTGVLLAGGLIYFRHTEDTFADVI
jgi:lipopolysaccharide transport system permease protein